MKYLTEIQMDLYPRVSDQLQLTLAPTKALDWLRRGLPAKVLHVFTGNINLMDQDGEILALVQPRIGPGPFSAVVESRAGSHSDSEILGNWDFTKHVDFHSTVRVSENNLEVGGLSVHFTSAIHWDPVHRAIYCRHSCY